MLPTSCRSLVNLQLIHNPYERFVRRNEVLAASGVSVPCERPDTTLANALTHSNDPVGGGEKLVHFGGESWTGQWVTVRAFPQEALRRVAFHL